MKRFPLFLLRFVFLAGVWSHNKTHNASTPLWPSHGSLGPTMGGHFGGPGGGGGGVGGGGATGADVLVNVRVVVPPTWEDAASLDALATAVTLEVEEESGRTVVNVASALTPTTPGTITITGALFGGGPTCPFYHEEQMASRCGLHVVNMLLGHRVYNHEGFAALVRGMELPRGVPRSNLMNPSGDYSQDLLEHALEDTLHPGRRERSCELVSLWDAEVFQRVRDGRLTSLVIQYELS